MEITVQGGEPTPVGELVDERAVVNGCVALLATGGSTNHTLHLVAIARAAGILLTWQDLADLSGVVPLLARVYPNGAADVNHFHAAGGIAFLVHTLLHAGLLHDDVHTVAGPGLWRYTTEARLAGEELTWEEGPKASLDTEVLRAADDPFAADGGLRVLGGIRGRGVIKISAVKPEHRHVTAPARVFDDQADFLAAFDGRGPRRRPRRGHALPGPRRQRDAGAAQAHPRPRRPPGPGPAGRRGHRRPDVRRLGKVPAAIHLSPEAAVGGPLARICDGDLITLDAASGVLVLHVDEAELAGGRRPAGRRRARSGRGPGATCSTGFRAQVSPADQGASVLWEREP